MDSKIAAVAGPIDPSFGQAASAPAANTGAAQATDQPDPLDMRLVIEEDHGLYVYKTVNRVTGEVVQQFPRAEVLRMRDDESYAAGSVVDTKA